MHTCMYARMYACMYVYRIYVCSESRDTRSNATPKQRAKIIAVFKSTWHVCVCVCVSIN